VTNVFVRFRAPLPTGKIIDFNRENHFLKTIMVKAETISGSI
jgi:hypothetical protein